MKLEKEMRKPMTDNPHNWKGPFYFNRRDYRLLVPKNNPSMGWTLNFASPYAWVTMALIFGIVALTIIIKK
jgi:uncharacterized membrane protein